jgi:hypothetical protein
MNMGEVLAHAHPQLQHVRGARADAGGFRPVGETSIDVLAHATNVAPHVASAFRERVLSFAPEFHLKRNVVRAVVEFREHLAFA